MTALLCTLLPAACVLLEPAWRPATASAAVEPATVALGVPGRLPGLEDLLVRSLLRQMTLEDQVGQLLFMSFEFRDDGTPVTTFTDTEREQLRQVSPGGVVLYGMNIRELDQTHQLISEIRHSATIPPIIATDHEGGLVARLNTSGGLPATVIPRAVTVGQARSRELARELGAVIGAELRSLGIVMNFAPVVDVDTGEADSVMGRHGRAYGTAAIAVAEMASAVVAGMQAAGVSAVVKHFPGHGMASVDSHDAQATVSSGIDRLRGVDLVPFRASFAAGADGVMTAHIALPAITGTDLPATLAPELLNGLLREELRFEGLVISDAVNMRGLTQHFPEDELAVRAVAAGVDIVLKPFDPPAAREAILAAVHDGQISESRVAASAARLLRLKVRRGLIAPFGTRQTDPHQVLGAPRHQRVVELIHQAVRE